MRGWLLVVVVLIAAILSTGCLVADGHLRARVQGRVSWTVPGGREVDMIMSEFRPGHVYWQIAVG